LFSSPPTPAHPPGTSAHEAGFAFDINLDKYSAGQLQTIIAVFTKYGFVRAVSNDPVHFVHVNWLNYGPQTQGRLIREAQNDFNYRFPGRKLGDKHFR
jgi:hypothetical protein